MRGSRPLTLDEADQLFEALAALNPEPLACRVITQCVLMLTTGLRIAECLALDIEHVAQDGRAGPWLYLPRRINKCKLAGHSLPLCEYTRGALDRWLAYSGLRHASGGVPLWPRIRPYTNDYVIGTRVAYGATRLLIAHARAHAGLTGQVSSHSLRKAHAARIYELTGHNVLAVKSALRHRSLTSTLAYLDDHERAAQQAAFAFFG